MIVEKDHTVVVEGKDLRSKNVLSPIPVSFTTDRSETVMMMLF